MPAPRSVHSETVGRFGSLVRQLRLQRGFTLQQLGVATGTSRKAVNHWEQGRGRPHHTTLPALAAALGVSADVLRDAIREDKDG